MTPEELKKMLEIANKGGWTYFRIEKDDYIIQCVGENFYQIYYKKEQAKYRSFHINEILFCPKFGEGYWGKKLVCTHCGEEVIIVEENAGIMFCRGCRKNYFVLANALPAFQFHQRNLGGMSDAERKAYMVQDLSHRLHR